MFCRSAKCVFLKFKPIPLFVTSSEIILPINLCQARLIHTFQSQVKCILYERHQQKFQDVKSISCISSQQFCSCVNANKDDKEESHNDENGQSANIKSINGSVLLANFKSKLDSGHITTMSPNDWSNLEKSILTENPKLKSSWEAICMSLIKLVKSVELSFSLEDYIKKQGRTLNIATKTAQICLIGEYGGPERHQQVLDLYDKLLKQTNGILDYYSLKNVVKGLCGTKHWKESFKLLEMLEPLQKYYTPMVLAALRENDDVNALMLLNHLGKANGKPEKIVYTAFLKSCVNSKNLNVDVLLNLMGKYRWFPLRETLFEIVHHLKRDGNPERWTEAWIKITKNGVCPSCHQSLMGTELANREFWKLQSTFLKKTLIGDDIYQRSHPLELKNFRIFVEEHAPFDIVIDSLNVASKISQHKRSLQLRKVVEYFALEKHMKVLVIGRKHMKKWHQTDMNSIMKYASCFFLENISKDDPYLLYAAMYSGPKTMFVSSDEMRDHKYLLGEVMGEIFTKWQRSRQIQFLRINKYGKIMLEWPRKENVKAQFNSAWHIPYDNGEVRPSWQDPFTWLCLRQST